MANTSCPDDALPDVSSLPIPQNINVMVAPGSDASFPPMVTCCQPNLVQVVDHCTLWCELPKSYIFEGARPEDVKNAAVSCLRLHGGNTTWPKIAGVRLNAGGRTGPWTVKQAGIMALVLSGLVYLM